MEYVVLACQVTLAGVFLFSFASKVRNRNAYEEFVASVVILRLARYRGSRVLALATVAAEAASVILLIVPSTSKAGLALAACLLTAFTTVIAVELRRGSRAPCRCFGASSTPLGLPHLLRNLILLAAGGTGLVGGLTATAAPRDPAWTVLTLAAAALALVLVVRLDDLVALFSPAKPATSYER
ncbi:MauE/DoxX family redox-associated membrane protein [Flindersiella endophytica]